MVPTDGDKEYLARVVDVISGDDIIVMVDLGIDSLYKKVRVRLGGVDTPDAYRAGRESEAIAVRDTVRRMVVNRNCKILVHSQQKSSWKVTLHILEHKEPYQLLNLNQFLIEQGYVYTPAQAETAA